MNKLFLVFRSYSSSTYKVAVLKRAAVKEAAVLKNAKIRPDHMIILKEQGDGTYGVQLQLTSKIPDNGLKSHTLSDFENFKGQNKSQYAVAPDQDINLPRNSVNIVKDDNFYLDKVKFVLDELDRKK